MTLDLLLVTLKDLEPKPDFFIYTGMYNCQYYALFLHHRWMSQFLYNNYRFVNNCTVGDNPPHDIWNETWTSQLNATDYVVNYVASKLPNVTIYPAFGNHGKLCMLY